MRILLALLALAVAGCTTPFHAMNSPEAEDPLLKPRLYPVSVHRLMEKSLESIESLPAWEIVHLDPMGGRVECRREDWRQSEHVRIRFSAHAPGVSSLAIESQGEAITYFEIPHEALREFLSALEDRIEVP